jgi:hypothetical protein
MFFELLATVFAGFAGGGVAFLISRITRGKFPKSLVLAAAAISMIGFSILNEYNWHPRTVSQLPEGVVVVSTHESRSWYRPWTYVVSYVDRFIAADTKSIQKNEAVPHQGIVELFLMERWKPAIGVKVAVDCNMPAQARMDAVTYADDGTIESKLWEALEPDAPLTIAACE